MTQNNEAGKKGHLDPVVLTALISAVVAIVTAFFTYSLGIRSTEFPVRATQTAEARTPIIHTVVVVETQPPVIYTQLVNFEAALLSTPTPDPRTIDSMDILTNWEWDFCNAECGKPTNTPAAHLFTSSVPGYTNEAVEVLYDVGTASWVLIKKNINPNVLSDTRGIRFYYKGVGASNSIEFKLLLRYPGDPEDTAFGMRWPSATDTKDEWTPLEALYGEHLKCWWPTYLCEKHAYTIDLAAVNRIEFGIANKEGDTAGLGRVAFDDLVGIPK